MKFGQNISNYFLTIKFLKHEILKFSNSQILKFSNSQILFFFLTLISVNLFAQTRQRCATRLDIDELKRTDKAAYNRFMKLEEFTNDYKQRLASNPNERLINNNGTITIPVVVHVIHNGEALGVGRNISDAQVFSQIATLNEDFNRLNADQSNTPPVFQPIAGNLNFQFSLACTDPNGWATSGINRVQSNKTAFPFTQIQGTKLFNNSAKHTNQGGVDAWPTDRYLNIWVCSLGGADGYSTFPSNYQQYPTIDGVLIDYKAFGSLGSAVAPLNKGRTATHEIGHWLNLIHIWGDEENGCNDTDYCSDTPNQNVETYGGSGLVFGGCNNCQKSCGNNGDMFMNYMDYTDDAYMNLFTNDQKIRARAIFQPGGPRSSFIDNYFKLLKGGCVMNASTLYGIRTPFCAANGNINWSATGGGIITPIPGFTYSLILLGGNGQGVLTASWNNFIDEMPYIAGYGLENSVYTDPQSPSLIANEMTSGGFYSVGLNSWIQGVVSFTGATGEAKNWRIASSNSQAYISDFGNNFELYLTAPYQLVKIQAEIPTLCGDKTVEYYFTGSYINFNYSISPNPATNRITITASLPNGRTSSSNRNGYEAQIFNRFSQLITKKKCPRGTNDIDIDVSTLPSNQFYTVKLISGNDVQTKTFFKQ